LTDEIKVATARSPAFGGFAGSPFAPGTMFSGNGPLSQIVKVDPAGNVNLEWSTMPNGATKGRFWGLQVDRTGVFNGDLIGATSQGYIYRINGAGVATQLAWVNNPTSTLQSLITVPNDPLIFGGLAGKILIGSETDNRLYFCDTAGIWGWWTVPVAIDDLEIVPPNENFFGDNYGAGNLLGVSAEQFESQGLVGKILATREGAGGSAALYALTWDFGTNTPHFEQIMTAAGSPVPQHWEDITFAPAGVAELQTSLPVGHYQISGAFGVVDDLDPVLIAEPLTAYNRYNYGATPNTGTPPEARINKGVMSVVEDYRGARSLLIVLDKSGDTTGGSLSLQLNGTGADLASSNIFIRDDPTGDSYSYNSGTGLVQWTWAAGQTDGAVIKLPFARPTSDPLVDWSIVFSTLDFTGLDGFVFLANGQEIDLGTGGFNFTLGIPQPPLPGDYNHNNVVDAADYTIWRDSLGQTGEGLAADGTGYQGLPDGVVDQRDYDLWKSHFGDTANSGSAAVAVPESATQVMFFAAVLSIIARRRDFTVARPS
jgi:hypothetical protein